MRIKRGLILVIVCAFVMTIGVSAVDYKSSKKVTSQSDINSILSVTSKNDDEVGLLVSDGKINLKELTISKSGDSKNSNEDYYGVNSALLVYNGGSLTATSGTIVSYGNRSACVYANKLGTINLENVTVSSEGKTSSVLVANEGIVTGKDVIVTANEDSSSAIKVYKGGRVELTNAEVETGKGDSPIINTAGKVSILDSALSSLSSGIVILNEGEVSLNNTSLDVLALNPGSVDSPKGIYMYQSGKKASNTIFNADSSEIATDSQEVFYITNDNAIINLKNNNFLSNSINFLKAEKTTKEGADVSLNLDNQAVEGSIVVDEASKVVLNMKNKSKYQGALLGNEKNIELVLDDSSYVVLTDDSYLSKLTNSKADNSNIYLNNHDLYVNGELVKGNNNEPPSIYETEKKEEKKLETIVEKKVNLNMKITVAIISIVVVLVVAITVIIIIAVKKNSNRNIY